MSKNMATPSGPIPSGLLVAMWAAGIAALSLAQGVAGLPAFLDVMVGSPDQPGIMALVAPELTISGANLRKLEPKVEVSAEAAALLAKLLGAGNIDGIQMVEVPAEIGKELVRNGTGVYNPGGYL